MSYTATFPFGYIPNPASFGVLAGGKVWFGVPNGNPAAVPADRIQIYLARQGLADLAIAQPLDIGPGGEWVYSGNPAQIKVLVPYCVQVQNSLGVQKYYAPAAGNEIADLNLLSAALIRINKAVISVDSFAALSTTAGAIGDQAITDGHTTSGIGSGLYNCVSSAGRTADGGRTAINGAIAWVLNDEDSIHVTYYGNGTSAAQNAVNAAGRINDVYLPAGDYIGNVTDTKGVMIEGPGRLFNTSNVMTSTYAEPRSRFVIGQEYLWSFHTKLRSLPRGTNLKVVFSGDSTTFGVYAAPYTLDYLFSLHAAKMGISGLNVINSGHSGATCREWQDTAGFLDQDIAAYPDMTLYIMRWGLNDGTLGYSSFAQYETDLRAGLTKLRAFKDASDLSCVLMTPNSTSETGARDEAWEEGINKIIKKAARDFDCTFIDTYAIWRDSRGTALGHWLDLLGAGQGIHPDATFNHWIVDKIAEVVLRPISVSTVSTNTYINASSLASSITAATASNDVRFVFGKTIYRTDSPLTFPLNGIVETEKSADGVMIQSNSGFNSELQKITYTRYAIDGGAWSNWRGLDYNLNYLNSWANFSVSYPNISYRKSVDGTVSLEARIKNASGAASQICDALPVGYRPKAIRYFPIINAAGTVGVVSVSELGVVRFESGDNTDVNIFIDFQAYA